MKAAVWHGPGDMRVETIKEPVPGPDDLLLEVICCNICGSDVRTYSSGSSSIRPGTILGHEFAGRALKAPRWTGLSEGDLVTAAQDTPCGECWYCRNGLEHICENKMEFGKHFPGAFAEMMVVPEIVLRKGWVKRIPAGMSVEEASLIEPASSCVHAQSTSPVRRGDSVLIIGAGPIGCIHAELAKSAGAGKVILADVSEDRLELAGRFQVDVRVNPAGEDWRAVVLNHCPQGVDLAISACPSPKALVDAVGLVRKAGRVVSFGGLPKDDHHVSLDGNRIHYDEVTVTGSYAYSRHENDRALSLIERKVIHAAMYVTSSVSLDEIIEGMDQARHARALKVQVRP
ncbi:MAG: zinc-binding dehydrogenase [Ignavibacteriales bacterium]